MTRVTTPNFLLALLITFSFQQLTAQTIGNPPAWNWVQTIGPSANDAGSGLVSSMELDDSGMYLTGTVMGLFQLGANFYQAPERSMLIAKLDHAGSQVLWYHLIPNGFATHSGGATAYLDKANGKYYCLGGFKQDMTFDNQLFFYKDEGNGSANHFLVQVDVSGEAAWLKTFSEPTSVYSVAADRAGNILMSGAFEGQMSIGAANLSAKGVDFFLAKFNPAGQVLWAQRGGGSDFELGARVATDAQNNIYLTCEAHSLNIDFNGAFTLQSAVGDGNILLAKYHPDGQVLWAKLYGKVVNTFDETACYPGGFAVDDAGNIYMSGHSGPSASIGAFPLSSPYLLNQYVAKFNSSGTPIWAKVIQTKKYSFNFGELDFDGQGNLYCAGQYRDEILFGNSPVSFVGSSTARNAYYARFNSGTGVLDWATFLSGSQDAVVNPTSMAVFKENSLLVGGIISGAVPFGNNNINTGAATKGYFGVLGPDIMVSAQQRHGGGLELAVFPNPANNFVQWKSSETLPDGMQVAVLNSVGQSVWSGNFSNFESAGRIELGDLPAGVYYLDLMSGQTRTLKKLVVE